MQPSSFNSPAKNFIRLEWNKNLIKFLSENLNSKLVYLGLPSPDAEDIMAWLDYISIVVAFQCRDYPNPSHPTQTTEAISKLQQKLSALERSNKISNYFVYDGYIEEVLLKNKDNNNISFELENLVHVFNLDFCNSITSPMEILDENGNPRKVYKFDAIKRLLEIQNRLSGNVKKFILFLTIHASYYEEERKNYSFGNYEDELKKASLKKGEANKRLLRSFIIESLKDYFKTSDFVPEFLPVIDYKGVNNFQLLHFTVIGISKRGKTGTAPFYQNFDKIIRQKFVTIEKEEFTTSDISLNEQDIILNPITHFKESETFSKLWSKTNA